MASDVTHVLIAVNKIIRSKDFPVSESGLEAQISLVNKKTEEITDLLYQTSVSIVDFGKSIQTKVIRIAP